MFILEVIVMKAGTPRLSYLRPMLSQKVKSSRWFSSNVWLPTNIRDTWFDSHEGLTT